jgi:hypothetical protein
MYRKAEAPWLLSITNVFPASLGSGFDDGSSDI